MEIARPRNRFKCRALSFPKTGHQLIANFIKKICSNKYLVMQIPYKRHETDKANVERKIKNGANSFEAEDRRSSSRQLWLYYNPPSPTPIKVITFIICCNLISISFTYLNISGFLNLLFQFFYCNCNCEYIFEFFCNVSFFITNLLCFWNIS